MEEKFKAMEITRNIPIENLGLLRKKIEKLNRKAEKYGLPAIHYFENGKLETETVESGDGNAFVVRTKQVTLTYDSIIKIGDWNFIGTILRVEVDGKTENIFRGSLEIPAEFKHVPEGCNHCNIKRRRNETYIVQSDTGEFKQVGSTCLQDFVGVDPSTALFHATWVADVSSAIDEMGMGGGRSEKIFNLADFLAHTVACVDEYGWISKTACRESSSGTPTCNIVLSWFESKFSALKPQPEITEAHRNEAEQVIAWARELPEANAFGYLDNIRLVAKLDRIPTSLAGLAASMVSSHRRDLADRKQRELAAISEYVGTIGKRDEFLLWINRVIVVDSDFGSIGIHMMSDAAGNIFVWKASGSATWLKEGERYIVKATVKDHKEYKGAKQTIVNRVSVVDSPQTVLVGEETGNAR